MILYRVQLNNDQMIYIWFYIGLNRRCSGTKKIIKLFDNELVRNSLLLLRITFKDLDSKDFQETIHLVPFHFLFILLFLFLK